MTAVAVAMAPLAAMGQEADSLLLGNSEKNYVKYIPVSGTETAGAALYYPQEVMKGYAGCQITRVNVAISYVKGMEPVKVFITRSMEGKPDYEQTFQPTKTGWCTMLLDSPYQIDGQNGLYIGYEVKGVKYIYNGTRLTEGTEMVWSNTNGWQKNDDTTSPSLYAVIKGDALPHLDICLGKMAMPRYVKTGQSFNITGSIVNLGLDLVSSITVALKSIEETLASQTIEGLSVANRKKADFKAEGLAVNHVGDYDTYVEITAVNGNADAIMANNTANSRKVVCRDNFAQRNVLVETFSTEKCTGCPAGHKNINDALEGKPGVVELGHHAGFYTDQYTLPESTGFEWFYSDYNLFAPATMFDRTNMQGNMPEQFTYGVPVMDNVNADNVTMAYSEAYAVPAMVSVNIDKEVTDDGLLKITVSGTQQLESDNKDPRLFVFVAEDSIFTEIQAGATGNYYHRHTARKSLTPQWGDAVELSGYNKQYEVQMPSEWNREQLKIVAFVANYDEKDKNNCRVLNASQLWVNPTNATDITDAITQDESKAISMHNGCVTTPDGYRCLTIFTTQGTMVEKLTNGPAIFPLPHMPKGVYIIKVETDKGMKQFIIYNS